MNIKEQIEHLRLHGFYATDSLKADPVADTLERLNNLRVRVHELIKSGYYHEADAELVGFLKESEDEG